MLNFMKNPIFLGIVILITGFAIGAVVHQVIFDHTFAPPFNKDGRNYDDHFKRHIIRVIKPDEKQIKEIEPIIDKYTERTSEITDKYIEDFSATMDSMHNELEPILTEDQKERMLRKREKMKRMKFKKKFKSKNNKWKKDRKGYDDKYGKDYRKGRGYRKGYGYDYGKGYKRDSGESKRKFRKDSL